MCDHDHDNITQSNFQPPAPSPPLCPWSDRGRATSKRHTAPAGVCILYVLCDTLQYEPARHLTSLDKTDLIRPDGDMEHRHLSVSTAAPAPPCVGPRRSSHRTCSVRGASCLSPWLPRPRPGWSGFLPQPQPRCVDQLNVLFGKEKISRNVELHNFF